jgi:hypothetical protein
METSVGHGTDALIEPPVQQHIAGKVLSTLNHLLEEMVHANGKLLPSPDRKLPPESFNFPLL